MIAFRCSAGHLIAAPLSKAGKRARCPRCGLVVHVPSNDRPRAAALASAGEPAAGLHRPASAVALRKPARPPARATVDAEVAVAKPAPDASAGAQPSVEPAVTENPVRPEQTNGSSARHIPSLAAIGNGADLEISAAGPESISAAGNGETSPVSTASNDTGSSDAASTGPASIGSGSQSAAPNRRLPPPVPKRLPPTAGEPAAAAELPAPTGGAVIARSPLLAAESSAAARPAKAQGYRADIYRRQSVYWLGLGFFLLSVFHLAPAFRYFDLSIAPGWARAVVVITLVELAFVAWMVSVPDWSTVRVAMVVFAVVAALYGAALAIVVMTPRHVPILLDLDEWRDSARLWCGAVVLLTGLMTYVAGSLGYKWRKAYWLAR